MSVVRMPVGYGYLVSCDGQRMSICDQNLWMKSDPRGTARAAGWVVRHAHHRRGLWTICRHCAAQVAGAYCGMENTDIDMAFQKAKAEEESKRLARSTITRASHKARNRPNSQEPNP